MLVFCTRAAARHSRREEAGGTHQPHEPRTSHCHLAQSPQKALVRGAHFLNEDTEANRTTQGPKTLHFNTTASLRGPSHVLTYSDSAPTASQSAPHGPTAPQPPTGAGSLPSTFASFQALPAALSPRPHLVVVGLTVGQALLLIVPVPQERLLALGTDEVLGVAQGGARQLRAGAVSPGDRVG